ncbi:MAG: hypothetical protein J0L84_00810, partial [Verrucomicrobia bacterium]|nr:hypothetical protein [Verrucomicrobiota bacterium]
AVVLLVLLPLLLLAVGLLIPYLSMRRDMNPVSRKPTESTLAFTVPRDQTTLLTLRYWSNGVSSDLPKFHQIRLGESASLPAGVQAVSISLAGQPGSSNWTLSRGGRDETWTIHLPPNFEAKPAFKNVALVPDSSLRHWLFPAADSPWGIEAILTTRGTTDTDRRYQASLLALQGLRRRRQETPSQLLDGKVTPADVESLDRRIAREEIELDQLADAVRAGGDPTATAPPPSK